MGEAEGRDTRARLRAAVLDRRGRPGVLTGWLAAGRKAAGEQIAAALHAEADAARLAPWLAIFFGSGILLYFAAPSEPSLTAAIVVLAAFSVAAWLGRERPLAFGVSLALLAVAAGFAAGCLRGATIAHPLLTRATGMVTLQGFVEARDGTERSDRIVLRLTGKSGPGADRVPDRMRVAIRKGTAPAVGEHVQLRARLRPLIGPAMPGGFDFARNGYFSGFGATGFVLGRATPAAAPHVAPLDIRAGAAIDSVRSALTGRIRAALPGESGAIAAALVTGVRDGISAPVNEAMRISGLAHVLSISGLHMVLVVGTIFAVVRGALALVPGLALRRPVKKWAAFAALAGTLGYLVLSGAAVATQRAAVMVAIVLIGVIADRPALTLRTLAAAAVLLLALTPESILNPSFQMSFAATLALVALYERIAPVMAQTPAGGGWIARGSDRLARWLLVGAGTSLAAGLATAIYAAFHFHRVAPYGLLANVLAMPVLSFLIMPAGLFSVLLTPFGYDAFGWKIMGFGVDLMLAIAHWVASLPGAEGRIAAFRGGAVLLATLGFLLLTIPVSLLRYAGAPVLLLAAIWAFVTPRPDVLVDAENGLVAVRGADGRLSILDARKSRLTSEIWLAADADGRAVTGDLAQGFRCDRYGCTARLGDGTLIAVPRMREAFIDDCREAALIVTKLDVPPNCKAPTIDGRTLATTGAVSLRRVGGKWIADAARDPFADRPWFGRAVKPDPAALSRLTDGAQNPAETKTGSPERDGVPTPDLPGEGDDQ